MPGVEQPALHGVLEQVVDRLPKHPGGLHADDRYPVTGEPVPQPEQPGGGRAELGDMCHASATLTRHPDAGDDGVLVNVESGAALDERVHGTLLPPPVRQRRATRRDLIAWNLKLALAAAVNRARGPRVPL